MSKVMVGVLLDRSVDEVWADVADISSHVDWMADAESITFTSESTEGVGTRFECYTKIGPLHTNDVMEVTAWEPGRSMGVRHSGAVTGEGVFTLEPVGPDSSQTWFAWTENLQFPWYMAGPLGAAVARPIFAWIWRRNLRALKARLN